VVKLPQEDFWLGTNFRTSHCLTYNPNITRVSRWQRSRVNFSGAR
jgi:hypothetical protein